MGGIDSPMSWIILSMFLFGFPQQEAEPPAREAEVNRLIGEIAESGRVLQVAVDLNERVEGVDKLAPGDPPLLAFRYFEGETKHRFGKLDLVMDDAGH